MTDSIRKDMVDEDRTPIPDLGASARRTAVEAALVEGHRRIYGFLVSQLKNAEDAKDVLQEFSLRAIRRADDLRDVQSVRGWLRRLLVTAIADHHRRSSRRRSQEVPAASPDEETYPADAAGDEADLAVCACLREVIGLLPPAAADLVRRIDLDGQPRAEVAKALTVSEATLAVRLHRARAKLRDLLVAMCLTCPEHGFLDCACDRARSLRQATGGLAKGPQL